jgi:hypothetical protein
MTMAPDPSHYQTFLEFRQNVTLGGSVILALLVAVFSFLVLLWHRLGGLLERLDHRTRKAEEALTTMTRRSDNVARPAWDGVNTRRVGRP